MSSRSTGTLTSASTKNNRSPRALRAPRFRAAAGDGQRQAWKCHCADSNQKNRLIRQRKTERPTPVQRTSESALDRLGRPDRRTGRPPRPRPPLNRPLPRSRNRTRTRHSPVPWHHQRSPPRDPDRAPRRRDRHPPPDHRRLATTPSQHPRLATTRQPATTLRGNNTGAHRDRNPT